MSQTRVFVNYQEVSSVDPSTRGLHFGDGHFTTLAVYLGKPLLLSWHLTRLEDASRKLWLDFDTDNLKRYILRLSSDLACGMIKILISRQSHGRGYAPASSSSDVIIFSSSLPDLRQHIDSQNGLSVGVAGFRLAKQPALAGLKHLNRLEQVFLAREVEQRNLDELVVLDSDGVVVEGIKSNVFFEVDGKLVTPATLESGVDGVMKRWLIETLRTEGIAVELKSLEARDVNKSSAIWFTNCLILLRWADSFRNSDNKVIQLNRTELTGFALATIRNRLLC
ncbi:MAG: aminodeoxychorismate lyase [Kangiellaceae bacterium]|nr:aminodeoxychorismate lyase [Kangiellaceae bacterium]|tara:strand:- start:1756 stop:2595 length:840 start_codon:yes stop_codon:yes gene_type:complete